MFWGLSMAFPKFSRAATSRGASNKMSKWALLVCLAAPCAVGSSAAWASDEAFKPSEALRVVVDKAKVVRIARPADTVIIGNPSVVDATIQDARTLVLTGRNFGITNLIVLDAEGDVLVDETVVVRGHETNLVRIYRQADRETLACSPVCENTVTVGDEAEKFKATMTQIGQRGNLSEGN